MRFFIEMTRVGPQQELLVTLRDSDVWPAIGSFMQGPTNETWVVLDHRLSEVVLSGCLEAIKVTLFLDEVEGPRSDIFIRQMATPGKSARAYKS